jgi:PIN domain nuclease of toxin-antitoxin system
MNALVDTHVLLWSFMEPSRLSDRLAEALMDPGNTVYFSPISLWEISIKFGLKKLTLKGGTPEDVAAALDASFFRRKPLSDHVLTTSYRLPLFHRDPFDRLIIWDAIQSGFTLLSQDSRFRAYERVGLKLEQ